MVDRLEELLELLEEEEEADEWEDVLALRLGTKVPASPVPEAEEEKGQEGDGEDEGPVPDEIDDVLTQDGQVKWMPDGKVVPAEKRDEVPEAGGEAAADEVVADAAGNEAAEGLWDEFAAAVMGPDGTVMLRRPGAGDVETVRVAGAVDKRAAAEELGAVVKSSLTEAETGLEGLYRRTVQAGKPMAQNLPVEQAGRTVRAEEPGRTAALTVEELDRAVRRDSWRYDGGMTLF